MKISYNWLLDYLTVKPTAQEVADILTSVGLEVEALEKYESLKGGLQGLVVGHVLELKKHPDADRLRVAKTDVGNDTILQIVCGAANIEAGQKVVVAMHGTHLYPISGEPFIIKKSKIRGVESQGMICAEDEIGLSTHHDGIIVLDASLVPGTPLTEVYAVYTDYTLEVNITPNRGDAMSHIGMARDIACWFAIHKKQPDPFRLPSYSFNAISLNTNYSVEIENKEACKRYSGIFLSEVSVSDSPEWLQNRLKVVGLKPINNIVDATNYILYEYGQPLHAFDADRINGHKIFVKNLPHGTQFITLDNKELKLQEEDLMICDTHGGMCIAGIYGGLNSGVTSDTKNIFLESAWFHPVSIRKTAVHHQLRTDAAMRFEKQVNLDNTTEVLKRAATLIAEISGGNISDSIVDVGQTKVESKTITLRYEKLNELSGFTIDRKTANTILQQLGFELITETTQASTWATPGYKNDCSIEVDLIEEVIRILGYDHIPLTTALHASLAYTNEDSQREQFQRRLQQIISGLGFTEVQNNSIFSAQLSEQLVPQKKEEIVRLLSYSNMGLDSLRIDMLMPLLHTVRMNHNRRELDLRLFEIGKVYSKGNNQYSEQAKLSLLLTGSYEPEHWRSKNINVDLFQLKGFVQALLQKLGITNYAISEIENIACDYALQWGRKNHILGYTGIISSDWLDKFDVKHPVFYTELDIAALQLASDIPVKFTEPPKYPAVRRDLALLLPVKVAYSEIEKLAYKNGGTILREMNLFDVYRDKKMGNDIKSYAVSFTFMDDNKTMVDAEIDEKMQQLMTLFEKELNATIRK